MLMKLSMKSGTIVIRFLLRSSSSITHSPWMHCGTTAISLKLRFKRRLPSVVSSTQLWATFKEIFLTLVLWLFFPMVILLWGGTVKWKEKVHSITTSQVVVRQGNRWHVVQLLSGRQTRLGFVFCCYQATAVGSQQSLCLYSRTLYFSRCLYSKDNLKHYRNRF